MPNSIRPNLQDIGNNIRKWRNLKGLKQSILADELGISVVALSKIETGKTDIPLNRLFQIAIALNIGVEMLFRDPETIVSQFP